MTDTNPTTYRVGLIVRHPRKPEWGPGRILDIQGSKVTVYFRDLPGDHPEAALRTIDLRFAQLDSAELNSDPFLDNLPPYADGRFQRAPKKRVTLEEGIEEFRRHYPLFFEDPAYIGDLRSGERNYKWAAHEQFVRTLGGQQLASLLEADMIGDLRNRALAAEGKTNLLAVFEKAAFRDGLRTDAAAKRYFRSLVRLLDAPTVDRDLCEEYFEAVESLPGELGKTSPAKWTIATILPYIAQPDRFMFLKPEVTKTAPHA